MHTNYLQNINELKNNNKYLYFHLFIFKTNTMYSLNIISIYNI